MALALPSRIREAIERLAALPEQRDALIAALERPGHALSPEADCRSGTLVLACYGAASKAFDEAALTAAVAVELQSEAAFLLDGVADGDLPEGAGPGEELALGMALSECAACVACEATRSLASEANGVDALIQFHRSCIGACAGQLLDSRFERRSRVTMEQSLHMTALKAGSLGRFAGGFGARLATRDAQRITDLEELGQAAFTFAQLVDDLRDACSSDPGRDDLTRSKKTVPLAFVRGRDELPLREPASVTIDPARRSYEQWGAWVFGALVAELILRRARVVVERLDQQRCAVQELERFIDSLERSFESVVRALDARSAALPRHPGRGTGPAGDPGRADRPDPPLHAAAG